MEPIRFGRGIRALRQRRRWRQEDLSAAAGVSRSVVARVEQGRADRVPYRTLARIAGALDARVFVRLDWQGEQLDRLIDARHAALVGVIVHRLSIDGWVSRTEVTFNVYGERGSVDVLAFHPETQIVLVVEAKSAIPELGTMLMTLDRKVRLAGRIAHDQGWKPRAVARLLVVVDGRSTRRRLHEHAAVLDAAFPLRGWEVRRWLQRPVGEPRWSGLWVPASDRHTAGTDLTRVRKVPVERRGRVVTAALGRQEVT